MPRQRRLRELRAQWGKAGAKDGWLAARYYELRPPPAPLDDKSWRDLEMPRIFTDLDTTLTPLGSQYLYRQLRSSAEPDGKAGDTFEAGRRLLEDAALREAIQLRLMPLRADYCARIADMLFGAPLAPSPQVSCCFCGAWPR